MGLYIVAAALLSFFVGMLLTKILIKIAEHKNLFDEPLEERKIHKQKTPNLGGVAIFTSTVLAFTLFYTYISPISDVHLILAGCSIVFLLGLVDDLIGVSPTNKLFIQAFAALVVTSSVHLRITNFSGFLGLTNLNEPISIIFSSFFLVLLMNAYNLFDGIDWLVGTFALTTVSLYGILFLQYDQPGLFAISIIIAGSLLAFLVYNKTPASIFMGDSGSLTIGMIIGILSMKLFQIKDQNGHFDNIAIISTMLTIPVLDTIRVSCKRLSAGKSPFLADRTHIHHQFLSFGIGHIPCTFILLCSNIPGILITFNWNVNIHLKVLILLCSSIATIYSVLLILSLLTSRSKTTTKPTVERPIYYSKYKIKTTETLENNYSNDATIRTLQRKKTTTFEV